MSKPLTHAPEALKKLFITGSSSKGLFCFTSRLPYSTRKLSVCMDGLEVNTAHSYTPVKNATSVDLATGKAQRTSVVVKALCISEQIRHANLGFFVFKTLNLER